MSDADMRSIGYAAVDLIVDHLNQLPEQSVVTDLDASTTFEELEKPFPVNPGDPFEVLKFSSNSVFPLVANRSHPRFFGLIPSAGNYVSAIGDFMASAFNVNANIWWGAKGPIKVELEVIRWLQSVCGYSDNAGGLFVSGGSHANLTGLVVARHAKDLLGNAKATVYMSDQTHSSIDRALKVMGFVSEQVRFISSDDDQRMNCRELRSSIEVDLSNGRVPFCVVANAGTTNTGAIDPFEKIVSICEDFNLWLHVDGAHGAGACVSPAQREKFVSLEKADSIALDPHKWLFQPYEAGCLLVKDRSQLQACFTTTPEYLKDVTQNFAEVNFSDNGIQLTRRFNAFKLWLSVQTFGTSAFENAIQHGIWLAERAEESLTEECWQLISRAQLGILTFRFIPPGWLLDDARLDDLQRFISKSLTETGFAVVLTTTIKEQVVIRLCTTNPRTELSDIVLTINRLKELGFALSKACSFD